MGLPELSFAYRAAAQSAANRSKKGVVALILRDEGLAEGVYTVAHEADIPTELGAENKAYIRRALTGYVSTLTDAVKARRAKSYIGKAVLPKTATDNECVVNFTGEAILSGGRTYTGAEYCSRIAGMLAGTPCRRSLG